MVTNDIFTREDMEFLVRSEALPADRIIGVQTGGCPHTAIREDASMNFDALDELARRHPDLDLVFLESGGDNLAASFSPELVDAAIYVIDVSGGDKIPRKGGPGVTRSDLLVINKIDLAPHVGASLDVMARDAQDGPRRASVRLHATSRPATALEDDRRVDSSASCCSTGESTGARPPSVGRHARLELVFGCRDGRTVLTHAYAEPPLRVGRCLRGGRRRCTSSWPRRPRASSAATALTQQIVVERGARVRLTSQSALQVHRSPSGDTARLSSTYRVEDDAELQLRLGSADSVCRRPARAADRRSSWPGRAVCCGAMRS